ncbi:MAG: hypothetical protein ACJ8F7_11945, partial [Gemmataceae bacterium]
MSQLGLLPIASLVLENPPLQASNALNYLIAFAQDGGGFALLGLWIWLLLRVLRAATPQFREGGGFRLPVAVLGVATLSLILFAFGAVLEFSAAIHAREAIKAGNVLDAPTYSKWGNRLMTMGGVLALLGVFVPFFRDGLGLSFRRIWALARLSFTEAVRRRIVWVFLVFLLLFLFPPKWWNPTIKPEDEIRDNISVIYTASTPLLLFAATLLTAFSIPTDIRNQTIHTVVTKPVQKFEIVIGRFLGYLFLTTLVLMAVFSFGLLMVYVSRVEPEAREESMKARVPLYGELRFSGPNNFRGESVGREWDYRKYMQGGTNSPYRANWFYGERELDRSLADQDHVRCEFSFDIFRTTKGEEGKGVFCTFFVVAWQSAPNLTDVARQYHERIKGLSPSAKPREYGASDTEAADWTALDKIAGELGYYEFRSKEIADYHTDFIPIPTGIVKKALEGTPTKLDPTGQGALVQPRMLVQVRLDSRTQFLGVAKPDLYLLAREEPFWLNFYKGAAGLWLRLCVVIGIAVTFSTY